LVGASALLTTTMLQQGKIIEALQEAGLCDQVKVMVGGAPVTEEWASKIGADGYAEDAIDAVGARLALMDTLRMPLMLWRLPRNLSASGSRQ